MNVATFQRPFTRKTPEQWQQIISDQKISGLSQKAYCCQHGLSLATFCNWKKKLASHQRLDVSRPAEQPLNDWIEVPEPVSETQSNCWDMELELPGGVTLRMRQA